MRATSSLPDQNEAAPCPNAALPVHVFRQITAGILREGKTLRFTAYGNSMHPQIQHGDIITLQPLARQPRVGEVIMLMCDAETARVMVHRVTAHTPITVTTRGDASPAPDGEFPVSAILGILTEVERAGIPVSWELPWHTHLHPRFRAVLRKVYHRLRGIRP